MAASNDRIGRSGAASSSKGHDSIGCAAPIKNPTNERLGAAASSSKGHDSIGCAAPIRNPTNERLGAAASSQRAMVGKIIHYSGWYSPELCQAHPDKLFVFGDNTKGFGMGGQAIIRHQPNAFGVPTKWKPSMASGSFFAEGDEKALDVVLTALDGLWSKLVEGKTIVIPVTKEGDVSLGLERARLKELAPSIYATIVQHVAEMSAAYGSSDADSLAS